MSVQTISLDDLLPLMTSDRAIIKIDIQGHEMNAINAKTASRFFRQMWVPIIYTGFVEYIKLHGNSEKRKEIDDWLRFLGEHNYTAHHVETREVLGTEWVNWPLDVLFVKKYW